MLPPGMKQLRSNAPIEPVVDMVSYHYTCCSTCSDMWIYVGTTALTHRAMSTVPPYYITITTCHHILDLSIGMVMVCAAAYPPRRTPYVMSYMRRLVGHSSCGTCNVPMK